MYIKRVVSVSLTVAVVVLAVAIAPRVLNVAWAEAGPDHPGVTIAYPGQLTAADERQVSNGLYTFAFALYDAATGGMPMWSEIQEDVTVHEGGFVVLLGQVSAIPVETLESGAQWLDVGVRGPGEADFTQLAPRQRLSQALPAAPSSPSSGLACPHDHFGEEWIGADGDFGLRVLNEGDNVGVSIHGYSQDHHGVWGETYDSGSAGVYGSSSGGDGVYGHSTSGTGVRAESTSGDAIRAEGTGRIYSEAASVLFLSPHDMVVRGSSGVTLTPLDNGGVRVSNVSGGTGTKFLSIPVSTFGTLFGSQLYVDSVQVCYQTATELAYINATEALKNDGGTSYEFYLWDYTIRSSRTRECYTVAAPTPHVPVDNSSWVQFNIYFANQGAGWYLDIYTVRLTLTEYSIPLE